MADVPISLYTSVVKLTGENVAPPSLPPSLEETQPAINPPGTSDISGLVPYNGAIDNVNLGEKGLSTGFVQYDTTPTDTPTGSGTVVWNPDKYTLDLSMGLGDSVQQIGMETYYTPVKNQTGSLIPDGTFVMATGSLGASGRITIAPAVTDGSVDSMYMLGVTTHDIADGEDGLVTWFGEIRGFNTNTKAPVGETWIDGTVLWNNPAVAGGFTSVEPQAPNLKIPVAIVISAGNNGVIFVRPRLGMRLTDLHDVDAFTPSDKDLISYDSALGHWNAKSLGSVIGGTSSQFLKGDGSLDSNSYALASSISGTTNYLSKFTASGTIGNSAVFESGGNVGIGTTTPFTKIHINGNDLTTGLFIQKSNLANSFFGAESTWLASGNGNNTVVATYNTTDILFGLNGVERMRITSSGNVGIGTNAPTNTLDVNGTARIRTLSGTVGYLPLMSATGVMGQSVVYDNGGNVGIGTASPNILGFGRVVSVQDSGSPAFALIIGTTSTADIVATTAGTFISTRTSTPLILQTNNLERARITSSGNLLIGTTTDSGQRLQVSGDGYFSGNVGIGIIGYGAKLDILNDSEPHIVLRRTTPSQTANLIRTHADLSNITIQAGLTSGFFSSIEIIGWNGTGDNPRLAFYTSGTEKARITSSGNVGIATTSPTNTLDVNGTARIRTLSGTTGYLPLLSSTGVMGQSVVYNTGAGSILIGTINEVSGHKVRISGGALNITNWQSSAGAYDKLSIDFGEFRGIGYDANYNEVFFAGTVTVPVKIDTDAPTDSLVINANGNVSVGGQLHSPVVAKGNSSTAVTFNWNDGNIQTVTLTANCTFTFSNPQSGASYQIIITQDATGGRTITWPTGIYWEGKTIPSLTGTASSRDIVTITYDGTNYNALIARNFGT